jgi:hypothetical protein
MASPAFTGREAVSIVMLKSQMQTPADWLRILF